MYEWQQQILDEIKEEPGDRKVNWICDYAGNRGKTSLIKHVMMEQTETTLLVGGAKNDVLYQVANFINPLKSNGTPRLPQPRTLRTLFINLPRGTAAKYVSYAAIESIKDGMIVSPKYHSTCCLFNNPHVYIFANEKPGEDERAHLTEDRWRIRLIMGQELRDEDESLL